MADPPRGLIKVVNIMTRASHYESFTTSGAGCMLDGGLARGQARCSSPTTGTGASTDAFGLIWRRGIHFDWKPRMVQNCQSRIGPNAPHPSGLAARCTAALESAL
jgi:hypothetical protein